MKKKIAYTFAVFVVYALCIMWITEGVDIPPIIKALIAILGGFICLITYQVSDEKY